MAIKLKHSKAFDDRRAAPIADSVDDVALATWKAGMIITQDSSGKHTLADGASLVPDPKFILTGGSRTDVKAARAITYLEGPDTVLIDTEGYAGSPVKGSAMIVGTGGSVGKLVIDNTADVATLIKRVALCTKAPDADGFAEFKLLR